VSLRPFLDCRPVHIEDLGNLFESVGFHPFAAFRLAVAFGKTIGKSRCCLYSKITKNNNGFFRAPARML